ncbi:MAG: arylsulfatase [Chthoniobacteraceae bacterium]
MSAPFESSGSVKAGWTSLQAMRSLVRVLMAIAVLASVRAAERPNIVLFLCDDLGFSDAGCYGGEIPTPHIDALAKGGLRFTQFYNNAVCGPTRASLLTGLYAQQVGHSGRGWNDATDFSKCVTLGEVLKSAGYRTLVVGKWQDRDLPGRRGFDRFFGPQCAGKISYFDEVQLNPFYLDETRVKLPDDFYLTDALTDYAVKFVDEALSKPDVPFFLYVAHVAPHWPLHAREADIAPHRERYRRTGWDEWRATRFAKQRELGLVPASWELGARPVAAPAWKRDELTDWQAERMAVYAAQVASLDRSLGRLMETIRKAGAADNTLVLFLSDNGAAPDGGATPGPKSFRVDLKDDWRLNGKPMRCASGPDNMPGPADTFAAYGLAWATTSNTPFRSTKLTAYEGGIRTPFIASWPAVIRDGGRMTSEVGHVIDLMPTFAEVAGARYPAELDGRKPLPIEGRSLLPTLRREARAGHDLLAWRVPHNRALLSGNWKLVESPASKQWELYDLAADGTETNNLAAQHPDIVNDLAAKWQKWADRCGAKP